MAQVIFFNVGNSNKDTAVGKKGDATLVDCDGKYVLIDGGYASKFATLTEALEKRCKKENGKIVLEDVIVTHLHPDHHGGIIALLGSNQFKIKNVRTTDIVEKGKESDEAFANLKKAVNTHKAILDIMRPKKATDAKAVVKRLTYNNTIIDLYSPPQDFRGDTSASFTSILNNSSILTRIKQKNGNKNVLLMGDMTYPGMQATVAEYSKTAVYGEQALFNGSKITVCKYGHHGIRGTKDRNLIDKPTSQFRMEIALYKNYVRANTYVFTPARNDIRIPSTQKDPDNVSYNFEHLTHLLLVGDDITPAANQVKFTCDGHYVYTL